jgi:hypothetical protein
VSAPDMDRVQAAVDSLGEHFDTVHIFVTTQDGANRRTFAGSRYSGNIYTRYGQVREWLITVDEQTRRAAPGPNAPISDQSTGDTPT